MGLKRTNRKTDVAKGKMNKEGRLKKKQKKYTRKKRDKWEDESGSEENMDTMTWIKRWKDNQQGDLKLEEKKNKNNEIR